MRGLHPVALIAAGALIGALAAGAGGYRAGAAHEAKATAVAADELDSCQRRRAEADESLGYKRRALSECEAERRRLELDCD